MCMICGWRNQQWTSSRRVFLSESATGLGISLSAVSFGSAAPLQADAPFGTRTAAEDGKADYVFRGGPIHTVDPHRPSAEALAVAGDSIVYVGDADGVEAFIGANTRVIDLKGRMLMPGFVEGHIHPIVGAILTRGVDLQFNTREETLNSLAAYAKVETHDAVRGFGWRYSAFPKSGPRREDLDRLWPHKPVVLIAIDGHSAWVNTAALKAAGVDRDTPDPVPGFSFFQRDEDGEATGWLVEVPALFQVMNAVAPISPEYAFQALEEWVPKASAAGITSVFDAGIIAVRDEDGLSMYVQLEQMGKLPFRVIASFYHFDPQVDALARIRSLREQFQSELVQAKVLKLNLDGGDAQHTAAMVDAYSDRPGFSGDTLLTPEAFADIVRQADKEGIDIHVHSFGDRAVRISLDAIEAAIGANPPRDRRHTLAHLPFVQESDLPRFAHLGVVAQFSAQWAVPDPFWANITTVRWGAERSAQTYRFGTIQRSGARLSLGTDWPAASQYSTFKPLEAIQVALTRQELGQPDQTPLAPADETITLEQAICANTLGSAYQLGLDSLVGSLEVGKRADLIVIDQDLFATSPHDIHKRRVEITMMNGRLVHGEG